MNVISKYQGKKSLPNSLSFLATTDAKADIVEMVSKENLNSYIRMSYQNRRRPIKGGKVEVKYLNKLLNESYKNKDKTNANIDDRYILDPELSTDKTKYMLIKN